MAIELGADFAIDGTDVSTVAAAVREKTRGDGADIIFECVGTRETLDSCVGWIGALGRRGRLVINDSVAGSVGATLEDLKEAVQFVGEGKIRTVVDSIIPLNQFQKGLDKIQKCECVGKIVCLPCHDDGRI
jgi:propanol-preferring alcohol dehydrogenase